MSNHVYKQIEITGTSPDSIEDAVNSALAKASESVRNMRWMEVTDIRGNIHDNLLNVWQVTIKVGFTLES
jgi:flavin-binding protein dodecin